MSTSSLCLYSSLQTAETSEDLTSITDQESFHIALQKEGHQGCNGPDCQVVR